MIETVLSGLRVIDLTQNVAGPFCTQVLGDFGAEVIKVERPGRGDDTRDWRPPEIGGQSSTFVALNRNKRSVCIDLDRPDGVALLKDLAASADIFIHSMKPGSAEARGFGVEDLKAVNPRLIYCAISAFGQSGPLKNLPGYDPLMQAFTGVMSVTGSEGDDPVRVGVSLIDIGTGMWAALGIFAGIIERGRTGQGLSVEASLLDTGVNWMTVFVASYLATGKLPRKLGSAMAMTAPYELFHSADGHVFIAAGNDGLFRRVCEGLGQAALADDPRFLTNPLRVANREALRGAITALTSTLPTKEIVARSRRSGAPCSEMHDVSQMLENEQVEASGMIAGMPIENAPDHQVVALPLKLDGRRGGAMSAPPRLGADTADILAELGVEAKQVAHLRESGIIG
ncbi:formyl-CoA transferase/CoA:oxalate CoA-transferase [Bosea sp. CRIB-10]|uniref:CaiB/BaiF CoA transferase family protein n=1 Tax=Bosea sp. CRIB-10 TaxID=378404 RepID=UPI0008EE45FA|nr:CaiB/BaiF CoA-transferase family protein [Bosea sp. CRIB-10]SFC10190.1 formyl-CoA transferase/CoA:oxalate CoA-transferase [Bosea sp. CRIB-10]